MTIDEASERIRRIAELECEVERLRTALRYYADRNNWYGGFTGDTSCAKEMIECRVDGWVVAQEALRT